MEKRFFISLLLCLVIMLGYSHYLNTIAPPPAQEQAAEETKVPAGDTALESTVDMTAGSSEEQKPLAKKVIENIPVKKTTLQNEQVTAVFSNIGGSLESLELNQHFDKKTKRPISLLSGETKTQSMEILLLEQKINLNEYFFDVLSATETQVTYATEVNGYRVIKKYSIHPNNYGIELLVEIENVTDKILQANYELAIDSTMRFENSYDERFRKGVVYRDGKLKKASFSKVTKKGFLVEDPEWVALQQKYFALILNSEIPKQHARFSNNSPEELRATFLVKNEPLLPQQKISQLWRIKALPTGYELLKSFDHHYELIVTGSGLWGMFRLSLLWLLNYFYGLFNNYGIAIIILTLIMKIIFLPLTQKSFSSMQKMQQLQPKMKALQDQYRNEPQKLNKEVMELYRKHKVNPLGGCFPMLLQMPVFIGLYQVLSESVELRGAPFFGWITDLSEPDKLFGFPFSIPLVNIDSLNILPLLMMVSMLLQQKLTAVGGQSKEQQNIMLIMMVVFGFIFYNLPSGLVLYWFLNNVFTIIHQLFPRKKDPDVEIV